VGPDYICQREEMYLTHVAFFLQQSGERTCKYDEAWAIISGNEAANDPDTILKEVQMHGLLRGEEQEIEFMHSSLQEYFVALRLAEILEDEIQIPTWRRAVKRRFGRSTFANWIRDDQWAESFILMSGLTAHSSALVREGATIKS
jgi:hypothetical protein